MKVAGLWRRGKWQEKHRTRDTEEK